MRPEVSEAGDSALLLELDDVIDPAVNAAALDLARAIRAAEIRGVRDVVSAIRSVAVYFDPLAIDRDRLWRLVEEQPRERTAAEQRSRIEVPVVYGGSFGPDLQTIAAFAGVPPQAVVDLHAGRDYRVFMLGFLPGFPYLGVVDERIAAPRHATPRHRVPAGSVGIAGRQTGIYPRESPGGWQIVGRTPLAIFDPQRTPSALFAPGDTVRFVPTRAGTDAGKAPGAAAETRGPAGDGPGIPAPSRRRVTVVAPGLLSTIQDLGRWGHQSTGVPVAGALDSFSHRLANALVGNTRDAATLEITLAGPELRFDDDAVIAVTGADLEPALQSRAVPMNEAVTCRQGSVLRFGGRRRGARAYVAFDGGLAAPAVLGSRATHVLSRLGGLNGRALRAGDTLILGERTAPPPRRLGHAAAPARSAAIRILPGPQHGAFAPGTLDALVSAHFQVAPHSDRMGYRLAGARLSGSPRGVLISGPTFTGAIQVPPSGEPVILMADRQTTGGYPQIATVISADLPAAGQLAPGDEVRFALCSRGEAIAALIRQEGILLALE